MRAAIYTDHPVRDFRFLKLSDPAPVDGDDALFSFAAQTVYMPGVLTPEHAVVVRTAFYGDLPNNGFSYVDENGETRCFALDISGMDGSLVISEITVR